MPTKLDEAKAKKAEREAADKELRALYAKVAADPAGSKVLADIAGQLADPDFECAGLQVRGEGFLARIREAARIDVMVRLGHAGK